MDTPIRYPLTVFYDGSCALCAAEMRAIKAHDAEGRVALVDCSAPDFSDEALTAEGVTRATLMERIHARDADGRLLVGADSLEALYRATGFKAKAWLWAHRGLRPILARIYDWVARHRRTLSRFRSAK